MRCIATKPQPADGKCSNRGAASLRRADDNEDVRQRLMEYYKNISADRILLAKALLNQVNGLGEIDEVQAEISQVLIVRFWA